MLKDYTTLGENILIGGIPAKLLKEKHGKKVMLVSLDIYRPAAQEQLKILAEANEINYLPVVEKQLPIDITNRALNTASLNGSDIII